MHYFSRVAVANYHRVGTLSNKNVLSHSLQAKTLKILGENPFLLLPASGVCQQSLICVRITSISASGLTLSTLLSGSLCISLTRIYVIEFKIHLSYLGYTLFLRSLVTYFSKFTNIR